MLIPRFSLRWLLSVTTASGLFFLIVAQAVRGEHWAQGLCLAALYLVACFVLYVLAWSAAIMFAKARERSGPNVKSCRLPSPPRNRPLRSSRPRIRSNAMRRFIFAVCRSDVVIQLGAIQRVWSGMAASLFALGTIVWPASAGPVIAPYPAASSAGQPPSGL